MEEEGEQEVGKVEKGGKVDSECSSDTPGTAVGRVNSSDPLKSKPDNQTNRQDSIYGMEAL